MSEEDFLMLYTDGLIENTDALGNRLPMRTVRKIMEEHGQKDVESILGKVIKKGQSVWQDFPPEDDLTILGFRLKELQLQKRVA